MTIEQKILNDLLVLLKEHKLQPFNPLPTEIEMSTKTKEIINNFRWIPDVLPPLVGFGDNTDRLLFLLKMGNKKEVLGKIEAEWFFFWTAAVPAILSNRLEYHAFYKEPVTNFDRAFHWVLTVDRIMYSRMHTHVHW